MKDDLLFGRAGTIVSAEAKAATGSAIVRLLSLRKRMTVTLLAKANTTACPLQNASPQVTRKSWKKTKCGTGIIFFLHKRRHFRSIPRRGTATGARKKISGMLLLLAGFAVR